VDGFVIFHTKLNTPRLDSFICSSLILQGSWSDHCNLKRKEKALLHGMWKLVGTQWNRLAMVWERKRWRGVPSYKRAPMCQLIKHLGTALNCLVWKILRTLLLVVDKSNHLSKQLLPLLYKWKALAHVLSLFPSAKGLSFTFMLNQPIPFYLKQAFELLCFTHPYVDPFNHVY
jgi:hypothetical protein